LLDFKESYEELQRSRDVLRRPNQPPQGFRKRVKKLKIAKMAVFFGSFWTCLRPHLAWSLAAGVQPPCPPWRATSSSEGDARRRGQPPLPRACAGTLGAVLGCSWGEWCRACAGQWCTLFCLGIAARRRVQLPTCARRGVHLQVTCRGARPPVHHHCS
jgi:hypothetical protein